MANRRKLQKIQQESTKRLAEQEVAINCLCYSRISSKKQKDELTIKRQISVTRQLFDRQFGASGNLVAEIQDEAYNFEAFEPSRGFWAELVPLVSAGKVNTIIVAGEDRIFRGASAELRGRITDVFRKNGVTIVSPSGATKYDTSQTSARLVTSIQQELGAISKLETVRTLYNGRRRRLQEDEQWRLSIPPFGYRVRVVSSKPKKYAYDVVEEEALIINTIFNLYCGNKTSLVPAQPKRVGSSTIARILNAHGLTKEKWTATLPDKVSSNSRWDRQSVLRVIQNETYTGKLTIAFAATDKVSGYADESLVKTLKIPTIVAIDLFNQAAEIYELRRNNLLDDFQSRLEVNWLHGLIQCPVCGEALDGVLASNKVRYYKCRNSTKTDPHGMIRAEDIEGMLEAEFRRMLESKLDFKRLERAFNTDSDNDDVETQMKQVLNDLQKKNHELKKLTKSYIQGAIKEAIYVELSQEIEADIRLLELSYKNFSTGNNRRIENTNVNMEQLRNVFSNAIADENYKSRILGLAAIRLIDSIILRKIALMAEELSLSQLEESYKKGYVTSKNVREILKWSPKKLISKWGKAPGGRKTAIDFNPLIKWKI